jgi:hypothetical protein
MKVITDKQPWAFLIVEGIKDIENRTWKCPEKYIGQRVLIHAGLDISLTNMFPTSFMSIDQCARIIQPDVDYKLIDSKWRICGAIIGSVEIVDCVINHPSIWAEKTEISTAWGGIEVIIGKPIYNWVLANPIKFPTPIPAKGKLGFWDFNEKI